MTLGERFAGHTVSSALATRATTDANAAYLRFGDHLLTYGQVESDAEALAAALASLGLEAGDRLALVLTPRPEFAVAMFAAAKLGVDMLAAPVSGNAKVVSAGKLTIVASGPRKSFEMAEPYLQALGVGVTYVGEGELARMVKICHNLLLGVVAQSLAEITVLAEKGGVKRSAFLEFINNSVMGSQFSRYKTPAFVNLDWTPTFTPVLLRKDLDLGLKAAKELGVPLPVTKVTRGEIDKLVQAGHTDCDFAILIEQAANASGLKLTPENVAVDDGLKKKSA